MSKKRFAAVGFALLAVLLNIGIFFGLKTEQYPLWQKIALCAAVDAAAFVCAHTLESLLRIPLDIYRDRRMFWDLVKNDFKARFAGSYLGLFWAFFQPLITICLYWFVFQVGLRNGNVSDHPFILFLMSGLVPWFYFSESWSGATNSLLEYNYLVKKVVFNVGMLPALKVASGLFVHFFFVSIIALMSILYGYSADLYLVQILYYIVCNGFLVLGLSYLTAAFTVFFRDMSQIVGIVLTMGVWLTPIMWVPASTQMPGWVQSIFKLNPIYYIVDGFRDCLLEKSWFWEKPVWSVYFWCLAIVVYLFGVKTFNKLKVHFSDVL